MTINDQNRDEKLQYDITRGAAKKQLYHQIKFTNMNISLVKIYYYQISKE